MKIPAITYIIFSPAYNTHTETLCPMLKEVSQRKLVKYDLFFCADDGVVGAHRFILGAQSEFMR